jgi:hypothetical protein
VIKVVEKGRGKEKGEGIKCDRVMEGERGKRGERK